MLRKKLNPQLISKLYREEKLSMTQIAERLKASPSSIRYWLDKNGIARRPRNEAINSWYWSKFHKQPFQLKTKLSLNDKNLKTSGVMLYWGEGAKSENAVKFTNSDPAMIRLFLRFLREICGIYEDRLKALIHIYPDHNESQLKLFWEKETGIPQKNFYKSYIHTGGKGTYKNKINWGTITINYADKRLLGLLLEWINEYKM